MNILALDSSAEILSVALAAGEGVWHFEVDNGKRHSELMMECIDMLFKSAGLLPAELNVAACMKGPGSFTGLRIGFSTAKGLSMALGIPLVSIPTLDCLAWHLSAWPGIVIPSMDSKNECFFTALYFKGICLTGFLDTSPELISLEIEKIRAQGSIPCEKISISDPVDTPVENISKNEPIILTGPGAELMKERIEEHIPGDQIKIDPEFGMGRAKELIKIVKKDILYKANDIDSGPLYLRKSDAELKLE